MRVSPHLKLFLSEKMSTDNNKNVNRNLIRRSNSGFCGRPGKRRWSGKIAIFIDFDVTFRGKNLGWGRSNEEKSGGKVRVFVA